MEYHKHPTKVNMTKMVGSSNKRMTQEHTHGTITNLDTVGSLDLIRSHNQNDFDSTRMVVSGKSKKGSSSEAVIKHRYFLKQRMKSLCNTISPSVSSSSLSVGVPSMKMSCNEVATNVEMMSGSGAMEELRSVMCELEEVALTLVFSDGSSQLRRSPTTVRNGCYMRLLRG